MPLLGQRQQVFTQKGNLLDRHTDVARARAKQISADADVVAQIEQLVQLESLVAHGVFLRRSEKAILRDMHAQFARARAKQISADADVVAQIEQLVQLESLVAHGVFLHTKLPSLPAL